MTVMFNVETDGAGNPIRSKRVYLKLLADGEPGYGNGESVESVGEVLTDDMGRWEAELIPNVDLIPEGSVYQAILRFRGGDYTHLFTVPDSGADAWIGDFLAEPPGALPTGALSGHLADALDAHDASAVSFTPPVGLASTNVQEALEEVSELGSAGLAGHLSDAADAHDAEAVSFTPSGDLVAVSVQGALAELDSVKVSVAAHNAALATKQDTIAMGTYPENPLGPTPAVAHVAGGPDVPVADGGTGASSAAAARSNLGAAADAEVVKLTGDQAKTGQLDLSGGRLVVPTSTVSALPAAGTTGRVFGVTDDRRGLWIDSGGQWSPVGHVVKAAWFGGKPDGLFDNRTAIHAAMAALAPYGGGIIYLGPGVWGIGGSGLLPTVDNITIMGAGMYSTSIRRLTASNSLIQPSGTTPIRNFFITDLTIDGNTRTLGTWTGSLLVTNAERFYRWVWKNVRLYDIPSVGLSFRMPIGRFEDCVFETSGKPIGTFVQLIQSASKIDFIRPTFRYFENGIIVNGLTSNSPEHIRVIDGNFDGGWWSLPFILAGEGGTVTYTATSVADTATAFDSVGITTNNHHVRAMRIKRAGTPTSLSSGDLTDTGASFVTAAVRRGDIVKMGTAVALVRRVLSETALKVEEWLDETTRQPVSTPTSGAYTVYGVSLGLISAVATGSATVDGWRDLDGNIATPSAGTRFEIMPKMGNYPLHCETQARELMVRGCTFLRARSDQCSLQGTRVQISDCRSEDGGDMGMTIHGTHNQLTGNTWRHNGSGGLFITGSDSIIADNIGLDNQWFNTTTLNGGDLIVTGNRMQIDNNRAERETSAQARHGFRMTGTDNRLTNNVGRGSHTVADFKFSGASTTAKLSNNEGTISVDAGTGTIEFGAQSGTGTPEGAVLGSIGDQFRRKDGGAGTSLYVKESGINTNTGWVAK